MPRGGRHHAVEHDPGEAATRAFDTAGSLGDVLQTITLRSQIARFLHDNKDEQKPADCISKPNIAKGTPDGA